MAGGGATGLALSALTWGDIFGCLRCVVAFAAVLLAPGYCVGWACDVLGFRGRTVGERLAWGVALSFGGMTLVSVLLAKYLSLTAVCGLAGVCALGFVGIAAWEAWLRRKVGCAGQWNRVGVWVAAAWVLFVVGELVDVGMGGRLYFSVTVFDHALRTAFVDAVARTGVPPVNPLFWPGHAAAMRYYYFWYVSTAVAARLAAATARQATIASAAWAGFGLAAIVGLYCRNFLEDGAGVQARIGEPGCGSGTAALSRSGVPRLAVALGLLAVTGLDILPVLAKALLRMPTDGDMEWWSGAQVSSWMDTVLWVPHHVAGLVCCLLGFLLVWMSKGLGRGRRVGCGAIAGVAFASAFGLSTWVAMAFAMTMAAWLLWAVVWERGSRGRATVLLLAGAVAAVALMPYLAELRGEESAVVAQASPGTGGARGIRAQASGGSVADNAAHLLRLGVRQIIPTESVQGIGWVARLARRHPTMEGVGVGLVLLLPGYFVELGFYGLVLAMALRAMRRRWLDEAGRTAAMLAVAGLTVSTFLRSSIVANNDFGMRSILIAQFFLLLLGVVWWEGGLDGRGAAMARCGGRSTAAVAAPPSVGMTGFSAGKGKMGKAMVAMAWIGLAGTVYQVVALRVYLPVEERLGRAEVDGLAERAMALRLGFDAMDRRVAKDAVVQYNTAQPGEFFDLAQAMMAGRQMALATPGCDADFGGEASACKGVQQGVARLFSTESSLGLTQGVLSGNGLRSAIPRVALSADEAREECGRLGVDDLIATRWDAVWSDAHGWVWTLPTVVNGDSVRVVDCAAGLGKGEAERGE